MSKKYSVILSILFLFSCKEIEIEQAIKDSVDRAAPVTCSLTMNDLFYITQQGAEGTCELDIANNTVTYTPDSDEFKSTDFCDIQEIEGASYKMSVDYSGDDGACSTMLPLITF